MPLQPRLSVLHLISSFDAGGMETLALRLAAVQTCMGRAAWVVAPRTGPLRAGGLPTGAGALSFEGKSPAIRAARLALIARRLKPAIIHVHNPSTLQYGALAKRLTGVRLVMPERNQCSCAE